MGEPVLALAFAAGVAVGVFCGHGVSPRQPVDAESHCVRKEIPSHSSNAARRRVHESAPVNATSPSRLDDTETCVEVVYADSSSAPSSEVAAAHHARQAKRAAARAAESGKRRDFLSSLNLDLLTADQQELHAEYTEAVKVRDALRKEFLDRRKAGEDIPTDLQKRLTDAESIIRADAVREHRALREAAARAHGLDETVVSALLEDLDSIDSVTEIQGGSIP